MPTNGPPPKKPEPPEIVVIREGQTKARPRIVDRPDGQVGPQSKLDVEIVMAFVVGVLAGIAFATQWLT